MAGFSMYARTQMLRGILTPDLYYPPADIKVALVRVSATLNSSVDQLIEPTTGGYARQTYSVGLSYWAPTGFGELYNVNTVVFPQVTASWGRISGWALIDTVANECLAVGGLVNPFVAIVGMVPKLEAGTITVGLYD